MLPLSGKAEWAIGAKLRWAILTSALLALISKLYCAGTTIGTTDTFLFFQFAEQIEKHGLLHMYGATKLFNHTPLIGEYIAGAFRVAQSWEVEFPLLLRLPGIGADLVAVFALAWLREKTGRPEPWAIVLFALSPVAFMVSGYHGNVDSLLTGLLLLSACFCVAGRPLECGVLLGLACNVKVVALLLGPVFFFVWFHRRQSLRFAVGAVVTTLAGWAYPLVTIPKTFLTNVVGYGGYWGDWGITYLLSQGGWEDLRTSGFMNVSPVQGWIFAGLKVVIVATVLFLSWRRRTADARGVFLTLALTWAVMFVFAPGGAPQYMVWLAPFILLASTGWYVALTASSTVFLFVFYNTVSHGFPWNKGISTLADAPIWRPWTMLPWLVLVCFLASTLWRRWGSGSPEQNDEMSVEETVPAAEIVS